jgi:RimJ/RimL family protein N-acetyltransferase
MPERAEPVLNVQGDLVALGPLRRELLELYARWANDFEAMSMVGSIVRPLTLDDEQAWYERIVGDEHLARFTIYVRDGLRPIGTTSLYAIHHANRTATFGIMIGERDCWGRGYGTEATRLVLDYGFNVLGLHNIMLGVRSWNVRGIRAYRRAGFKEIGRRRQAIRLGGRVYDEVLMDCLASEFSDSPHFRQLLPDED